jgi:two-component system, NtrC family, sensor histidine kinase KinB
VNPTFHDPPATGPRPETESTGPPPEAAGLNRAILEAIPSPVFIVEDVSGTVHLNPAAGTLSRDLGAHGRLPPKIKLLLDGCVVTGHPFTPQDPREAMLFRIHSEDFYYLPRIIRFESGDPASSGWVVLLHDVSRIRWLDGMKTDFLSTVSHELRSPLTGIRMVLHLLMEDRGKHLSPRQRVMVASANEDSERLLATLNKLLDLSRAESGAPQLTRLPVDLGESARRAAGHAAAAAAGRGIRIEIAPAPPDLPEVLADPTLLDEVINILVANAIQHSPEDGTVTLRLARVDARQVRVSVIDQGPGVPDSSRSRIFERFYQVPGQPGGGNGLGLFIAREIMIAHEGRIGLAERADLVTEFFIDLPLG